MLVLTVGSPRSGALGLVAETAATLKFVGQAAGVHLTPFAPLCQPLRRPESSCSVMLRYEIQPLGATYR